MIDHENWPAIGDEPKQDRVERDHGKIFCPGCGHPSPVVATAYGLRTCCGECCTRWTKITGETDWTPETYDPMGMHDG